MHIKHYMCMVYTQIGETNIFCLLQLQHCYLLINFNEICMQVHRVECMSSCSSFQPMLHYYLLLAACIAW